MAPISSTAPTPAKTGETPHPAHCPPLSFHGPLMDPLETYGFKLRKGDLFGVEVSARPARHTPGVTRSDGASVPDDHVIVLFGALGDLAKRKLLPGLFHLDRAGLMPERYKVIGTSRKRRFGS